MNTQHTQSNSMNAQHTPGPWKLIARGNDYVLRDADGEFVQYLKASRYHDDRRDPVGEANARLIASAPELLAALEAMIELVGDEDLPDNGELSGAAVCDLARQAIAKAKGGAL